jgi:hypothetical protein
MEVSWLKARCIELGKIAVERALMGLNGAARNLTAEILSSRKMGVSEYGCLVADGW